MHGPVYVTGGSSGLGYAFAVELVRLGLTTVLFARNSDRLDAARTRLAVESGAAAGKDPSPSISTESVDVCDADAVDTALERAAGRVGAPRTVIHAAGVAHCDYFERLAGDRYRELLEINLTGTWNVLQSAVALMRTQSARPCHLLVVSSQAGAMPVFGYTAYGATKFAVHGLTLSLRQELYREGIYLSLLSPPDVATPQLERENRTKPPETSALSHRKPLSPEEVARYTLPRLARRRAVIVPSLAARLELAAYRFAPALAEGIILRTIKGVTRA